MRAQEEVIVELFVQTVQAAETLAASVAIKLVNANSKGSLAR
jgi:hypothetical protein